VRLERRRSDASAVRQSAGVNAAHRLGRQSARLEEAVGLLCHTTFNRKSDCTKIDSGPTSPLGPKLEACRCGPKIAKKSTRSVGGDVAHRLGRKSARPKGAVGLLLPAKIDQNRLALKSTRATTANPRLRHWTSPVAPQRPRTVPTGRPPGRRPAQPRPIARSKQVDGSATVHGRHRPAAMSTEVAAAKPGLRHWTPPVAPWRLSTPPTGGCQARRPAQPRPGLHQPRRQPGKP